MYRQHSLLHKKAIMIGHVNANNRKASDGETYEEVPIKIPTTKEDTDDDTNLISCKVDFSGRRSVDVTALKKANLKNYYDVKIDKAKQEEVRLKLGRDITPSYFNKNIVDCARFMRYNYDANSHYQRTRRSNAPSQKLRIGPVYVTDEGQNPTITQKPGKLQVPESDEFLSNHAIGMLAYFEAIGNRIELCEIDLNFIKSMIDAGVDVNRTDKYGQTVLYSAVRDWHHEVTQFLIDHGANVNSSDNFGRTPLHLAAALNCVNVACVLLRAGGDPNTPTQKDYQTPLHFAAKHDSAEVLTELLVYGGTFSIKDHIGRTPLFVAAHRGCSKTSRHLLESGAPCFIFDTNGDSIISGLVEKLPNVAASGLDQFILKGEKTMHLLLYLAQLENKDVQSTKRKSVLELITLYKDRDLLMHPIIQKSIEIKWHLFGRRRSIFELFLVLLHMGIWFALAYTQRDHVQYYTNDDGVWNYDEWRIVLEILVVLFSLFFFFRNMFDLSKMHVERQQWKEQRRREIRRNYIYCHPAWPEERALIARNEEVLDQLPFGNERQFRWFVYETVTLALLGLTIVTRVLAVIYFSDWKTFLGHKVILSATILFSSIRALKVLSTFPYLAELFCACSYLGKPLLQTSVLFLQFYIPFVALCFNWFYVTVETPNTNQTMINYTNTSIFQTSTTISANTTLTQNNIPSAKPITPLFEYFAILFKLMFIFLESLKVDKSQQIEMYAFVSIFQVITFIFNAFLIAIITSRFKMIYQKARAEASLVRAEYLVKLQKELKPESKDKMSLYYNTYCNPLLYINREARLKVTMRDLNTMFNILKTKLESVSRDIEDIERHSTRGLFTPATFMYRNIIDNMSSLQKSLTLAKTSFPKGMAKIATANEMLFKNVKAVKKSKK